MGKAPLSSVLVVALFSSSAAAQTFEVTQLGVISGTTFSAANALNNQGVVVGRSGNGGERLFLWDATSGLRDLNAPYPLHPYQAVRMNQGGQLAGIWNRAGLLRPFTWANGVFTELPDVSPGWIKMLRRITDGGLVHYQGVRAPCNLQTAVLFGGVPYRLDQVLGSCWSALDIADGPVVAGYRLSGSTYQAVVRQANGQTSVVSPIVNATVFRIGAGGHYAGLNWNNTRMFLTAPGGGYREFPPLPGMDTLFPESLNRLGEVVGASYNTVTGAQRPFIIRNGQMRDLTTIAAGMTLVDFIDINDHGDIVGTAELPNGQRRAVLLRPTDRTQNLRASVAGNTVTLTWTPPVGAPAGATYLLDVGSVAGASDIVRANLGPTTSIGGIVPDGTYHVRVTMVHPNDVFGAVSEEVQFSVPAAPGSPTVLAFSLVGRTLTLSWSPPVGGGVVEYIGEAGSTTGAADLYNGSIGTAPGLTVTLRPGTYYIRVRARNTGGLSAASNEIAVVVP